MANFRVSMPHRQNNEAASPRRQSSPGSPRSLSPQPALSRGHSGRVPCTACCDDGDDFLFGKEALLMQSRRVNVPVELIVGFKDRKGPAVIDGKRLEQLEARMVSASWHPPADKQVLSTSHAPTSPQKTRSSSPLTAHKQPPPVPSPRAASSNAMAVWDFVGRATGGGLVPPRAVDGRPVTPDVKAQPSAGVTRAEDRSPQRQHTSSAAESSARSLRPVKPQAPSTPTPVTPPKARPSQCSMIPVTPRIPRQVIPSTPRSPMAAPTSPRYRPVSPRAGARPPANQATSSLMMFKPLLRVLSIPTSNKSGPRPKQLAVASRREREAIMAGTVVPKTSSRATKPPPAVSGKEVMRRGRAIGRAPDPETVRKIRVKRGDNLVSVSKQHNMRIRDLQRLNGLKSDHIVEGDMLTVATGWLWKPVPPTIRPGLRRTLRPLFSRVPRSALPPPVVPPSGLSPRPPLALQMRALGVGGPATSGKGARMLEGKWKRGPKGFNKQNAEWHRFSSPLVDGFVSSSFGWRWGSLHEGVDLAAESGSPILASEKGVVTYSGWSGGYGKLITISHEGGFSTRYGHCSVLTARVGQRVARGQQVACVGATGRATGPHVHFEVRRHGEALDPFNWCDL